MNLATLLRVLFFLEHEYDEDDSLSGRIQKARDYVDSRTFRAEIVQSLPPSAPGGYLMVTPGDTNLYVGAGTGSPLRKIPTQPL